MDPTKAIGFTICKRKVGSNPKKKQIGVLTNLSSIYESSAWGFEGPDFFNACIEIQTDFSALELLEKLLEIERQMGRIRSINPGYNSREIDLDLLLFEDQVINNEHLILPHPRIGITKLYFASHV